MASRILLLRRPALPSFSLRSARLINPTTTACATSLLATPLFLSAVPPNRVLMDSFATRSSPLQDYQRNAKTPIVKDGRWNEKALKQVSSGSILGLVGGVLVSFFSKPLALLIGLLIFGAQVGIPHASYVIQSKR